MLQLQGQGASGLAAGKQSEADEEGGQKKEHQEQARAEANPGEEKEQGGKLVQAEIKALKDDWAER